MSEGVRPYIGIVGVGMVGQPLKEWFEQYASRLQQRTRGIDLFCFDTDPARECRDDVNQADVIFVCVPTPPAADGNCDTRIVRRVVSTIQSGKVVVIKSTVTPGTTQKLQDEFPKLDFLFCPEFLSESRAGEDFRNPSRQIVGATPQSRRHAAQVLALLPQGQFNWPDAPIYGPLLEMTTTEAELVKYASNCFGAMKVTFANHVADYCYAISEVSGQACRSEVVLRGTGQDKRILPTWMDVAFGLYCGYGGYCFPKDTVAHTKSIHQLIDDFLASQGETRSREDIDTATRLIHLENLMEAMTRYNTALLASQGLTVADVSDHDKNLKVAQKRRQIRVPRKKK